MAYSPWSVVFQEQPTASKWNQLGENDASFNDGTGIEVAYQDWTPTFTSLSGGTLNEAKYIKIGHFVQFVIKYTLAGAGVSGSVRFTTPTTMDVSSGNSFQTIEGRAIYYDANNTSYSHGPVTYFSSTAATLNIYAVDGIFLLAQALDSTTPITWAVNDIIYVNGSYKSAT